MTRVRAIAIAAIVTLIAGSTAAGITGNIGGNGGATVAVADAVAPAGTTSSQPAQVAQLISHGFGADKNGVQASFEDDHVLTHEEND